MLRQDGEKRRELSGGYSGKEDKVNTTTSGQCPEREAPYPAAPLGGASSLIKSTHPLPHPDTPQRPVPHTPHGSPQL
ncbi:hypothetical protein E2C01_076209 [Portunus trituberculatus]|uniref:Uncharacterized protein n=1 Tax=Portunus trituberculatus TaxID=210409 RepID=A0A5B7IN15_PORTR|nr:hypothetical protein [Portunus trituberculatus]